MSKNLHKFIKSDDKRLASIDKKTKALCTLDWCRGVSKYASNAIIKHRKNGTIKDMKNDIGNTITHYAPSS